MDGGIGRIPRPARWQNAAVSSVLGGPAEVQDQLIHLNSALASCPWQHALLLWSSRHRLQVNVISYTAVLRALRSRWVQSLHWLSGIIWNSVRANCITLNTALNALQQRGHWRRALKLLVPEVLDAVSCNTAISACEEHSKWPTAVQLLERFPEEQLQRDVLGFSAGLGTLKGAKWPCQQELLRWMRKDLLRPNLVSLSLMVKSVPWPVTMHLLGSCQEDRLLPDTILFGASISCCSSGLAWRHGLALARQRPSLIGCNAAMDGCQGAWFRSVELFKELRVQGFQPSVASYNVASQQWSGACRSLGAMSRKHLKCDVISFGVALGACQMQSLWLSALQLMQDLGSSKLPVDQVSCNSCTSACGEADQWQTAMQMAMAAPATATCNAAISACDGPGEWQIALQSLHAMPLRRLRADLLTYNALCSALRPAWRMSMALMDFCSDLAGFSAVIGAYESKSLWKPALGVLNLLQLRTLQLDTIVYNGASSTCAKGTQWQLATKALAMLPTLLLEQQDYTFNAVVSACAKAELEATSNNSIALSLQQMNEIRQTLVTTLSEK